MYTFSRKQSTIDLVFIEDYDIFIDMRHVVIMAGGAGKRLWPASYSKQPKQLMELSQGKTLLLSTLERALAIKSDGKIIIVTHNSQSAGCLEVCEKLSPSDKEKIIILGEPEARNTAPALALAARWVMLNQNKSDSILVMAADHIITPVSQFVKDAETAFKEAEAGKLVTFGIQPDYPSTGYGYIESSVAEKTVRKVLSFKEKPNKERASEFVVKGNYFWNSGMFAYRADQFFKELAENTPEVADPFLSLKKEDFLMEYADSINVSSKDSSFNMIYGKAKSISIDYALMEKSSNIVMVLAGFEWNDVGSWDSIADSGLTDDSMVFGDANENYIFSDLPVAVKGVDNLIVVVKNGSVMICPRGESQLVKELVEEIAEKGHKELL